MLNLAGIEPVVIAEERCCGHDLLWSGDHETFAALASVNAAAFEARGVRHIVSACAECTRTWKIDYADAVPGYKPTVEHLSEFLARLTSSGALPVVADGSPRVTFQDPCRLARHVGVTEAPRELLGAMGAEVVEMARHGADAQCCGTAGFLHCDADSRKMQEDRLKDAAETGAEVLLTACPKCWIHFACAQREDAIRGRRRDPIPIEDLTLFAARRAAERGDAP
jgi:Fe-S oxidoreductase